MSYHPMRSYFESTDQFYTRVGRIERAEVLPSTNRPHYSRPDLEPIRSPMKHRMPPLSWIRALEDLGRVSILAAHRSDKY